NSTTPSRDYAEAIQLDPTGARTEQCEDMLQVGIIDPAKVVCSALQDAASVSRLPLTSDALLDWVRRHIVVLQCPLTHESHPRRLHPVDDELRVVDAAEILP